MSTTARVTVTVEVNVSRPWSNTVPLKTVYSGAKEDADKLLNNIPNVKVVGPMKVHAVIQGEDK